MKREARRSQACTPGSLEKSGLRTSTTMSLSPAAATNAEMSSGGETPGLRPITSLPARAGAAPRTAPHSSAAEQGSSTSE
eukprot:scaffold9196_cov110-Isochrysis_galbana.AAC.7